MYNGSSCKWVAWQCNAAAPHTEVYWIGSCSTPASSNPCGISGLPCDNCFAAKRDYVSQGSDRHHKHVVSGDYTRGIDKNSHREPIFLGGARPFEGWEENGKLVRIRDSEGRPVFIRIWKVQVTDNEEDVATVGHEVPRQPGAVPVDQPAAPQDESKIVELEYQNDDFTVILDPMTKLPE